MTLGDHIAQLGWTWTRTHVIVAVSYNGRVYRVAIPISRVHNDTARELAAVGCPMGMCAVGAPMTCGGFFSSLKRAVKRASRAVKKAVPKSIRRMATKVYRRAAKAVRSLRKGLRSLVRSPVLKAALLAASVIPGAAVITVPAAAALQAADSIDRAIAKGEEASRQIARGVRTAEALAAKQRGAQAINHVKALAHQARRGNRQAAEVVSAFRKKL